MNVTRVKKQLILYLPYILIGLMATKLGEAWRFSPGVEIGEKLRNIMTGAGMAFQSPLPSFQPLDLLIGILGGALVRVYVVTKGKNAKKYRKNVEYPNYRYLADADPKNTFNYEEFLSHALKLRAKEMYDTYEVTVEDDEDDWDDEDEMEDDAFQEEDYDDP